MTPAHAHDHDAERIVAGLSNYEQGATLALCDGEPVRFFEATHHWRLQSLISKKLLAKRTDMEWEATDLGRAVFRALVKKRP